MDQLDEFINDIINQKQLSGVTPEVREQLVEDLRDRLLDQVNRALIEALPEDKIDEFSALIDQEGSSDELLQQFLTDNGVNIEQVTTGVMLRFRDLYLERPSE